MLRLALVALLLAALPLLARGQEGGRATLHRPETPVVVRGEALPRLLATPIKRLRLLSWREGQWRPAPYQVDERTADGGYAYDLGAERRSDTDDGLLDPNDEVVFMARDAGDRAPPAALDLGQSAWEELTLTDPLDGGQAWLYLMAYVEPPERAAQDYVSVVIEDGELVGWQGERVRACGSADGNLLHLNELRFAEANGYGGDVLDRVKLDLRASYLFTELVRHMDELRASVQAWSDGPVRVLASLSCETYLIWGHWIRPAPVPAACRLAIYANRLELRLILRLPVDLERDTPSQLRISLDFAPEAQPVLAWSDRNIRLPWRGGSADRRALAQLDQEFPAWVCVSTPGGSLLGRLRLGEGLARRPHRLFLADGSESDPPEDVPGSLANTGVVLDLTGLAAGTYELELTLQFGAPTKPGQEEELLRPDVPVRCQASRR